MNVKRMIKEEVNSFLTTNKVNKIHNRENYREKEETQKEEKCKNTTVVVNDACITMNERIDKYNEYIKAKNELNLIYEQFDDKDNDEAKSIKEQIDICQKDWEEFNKKNLGQNDKYFDMVQLNEKEHQIGY